MNKSDNIVANKSYTFAIDIINLYKSLTSNKEYVLSKQMLRSGTSIGAMIKEAEHAQSKADFLNKMNIALKEANETSYWLMLLRDTDYISENQYREIYIKNDSIIRLLVSIVKTTKKSLGR